MTNRFADLLKRAVEATAPDLRKYMRFSVPGKVIAVHDDDRCTVDVEVADVPAEGAEQGPSWLLPDVPVRSIAGGDGWGVFAMPADGSEVTVGFKDGDVTQPYVEGSEFLGNRTPIGNRAGSFTFADQSGQRITMRPDTGETIFRFYNMDSQVAGARTETTMGSRREEVGVDDEKSVGGRYSRVVKSDFRVTIENGRYVLTMPGHEERAPYDEEMGAVVKNFQYGSVTRGSARRKILGREAYHVGGDRNLTVLGDGTRMIGRNVTDLILGTYDCIVAGAPTDPSGLDPRHLAMMQIGAPLGINCFGGYYQEPGTGVILGRPMVDGISLSAALSIWLAALDTCFTTLAATAQSLTGDAEPLKAALTAVSAAITTMNATLTGYLWVGYTPTVAPPAWVLSPRHFMGGPI